MTNSNLRTVLELSVARSRPRSSMRASFRALRDELVIRRIRYINDIPYAAGGDAEIIRAGVHTLTRVISAIDEFLSLLKRGQDTTSVLQRILSDAGFCATPAQAVSNPSSPRQLTGGLVVSTAATSGAPNQSDVAALSPAGRGGRRWQGIGLLLSVEFVPSRWKRLVVCSVCSNPYLCFSNREAHLMCCIRKDSRMREIRKNGKWFQIYLLAFASG